MRRVDGRHALLRRGPDSAGLAGLHGQDGRRVGERHDVDGRHGLQEHRILQIQLLD